MDVHKKMQTMSSDGDDYEAGIDIEQAKKSMAEEDKFDKQLYRNKIKQKHKVHVFFELSVQYGHFCFSLFGSMCVHV